MGMWLSKDHRNTIRVVKLVASEVMQPNVAAEADTGRDGAIRAAHLFVENIRDVDS